MDCRPGTCRKQATRKTVPQPGAVLLPLRCAGFTLLELMIVVAIVGILSAVALPSYWNYVIETRLMGDAQLLAESIHLARTEAATRSEFVTLCPSTDGASCNGSFWEDGWIVFVDEGTAGVVDSSDEVLRAHYAFHDGTTINASIPANSGADYVQIDPNTLYMVRLDEGSTSVARARNTIARVLARLSPIHDAFAAGSGGNRNGTGGIQSACSAQNSSNNINSAQCNAPLAIFTFCSTQHGRALGPVLTVYRWGNTTVTQTRCP